MAIYTTFFLCKVEGLATAFPGWKPPLATPVSRTWRDPFTGQPRTTETREPNWDDFDPSKFEMPAYRAVAISGDYASYLEQRIPPFVKSKPHWCAKNLTSVELAPLISFANGEEVLDLEIALYAHPSLGKVIEVLPDKFTRYLASADDGALRQLGTDWAAKMSSPEYTHSANGTRLEPDMSVEDAMHCLNPMAKLARQQDGGASFYLLTEA